MTRKHPTVVSIGERLRELGVPQHIIEEHLKHVARVEERKAERPARNPFHVDAAPSLEADVPASSPHSTRREKIIAAFRAGRRRVRRPIYPPNSTEIYSVSPDKAR